MVADGTRRSQQRLEFKTLISKWQSKLTVGKHKQKVENQRDILTLYKSACVCVCMCVFERVKLTEYVLAGTDVHIKVTAVWGP